LPRRNCGPNRALELRVNRHRVGGVDREHALIVLIN
jgi:hypothetical protein